MHQSLEDLSVDKSLHEEHVQTVKEQLDDVSDFVQVCAHEHVVKVVLYLL